MAAAAAAPFPPLRPNVPEFNAADGVFRVPFSGTKWGRTDRSAAGSILAHPVTMPSIGRGLDGRSVGRSEVPYHLLVIHFPLPVLVLSLRLQGSDRVAELSSTPLSESFVTELREIAIIRSDL